MASRRHRGRNTKEIRTKTCYDVISHYASYSLFRLIAVLATCWATFTHAGCTQTPEMADSTVVWKSLSLFRSKCDQAHRLYKFGDRRSRGSTFPSSLRRRLHVTLLSDITMKNNVSDPIFIYSHAKPTLFQFKRST